LDAYFLYSSTLGTQTFFMIGLPLLFFFGYDELGRGYDILSPNRRNSTKCSLVIVLASGVYFTSFAKDLFCAPRPFAPPVTRLSKFIPFVTWFINGLLLAIGTHHLEYGFPSTHSTNSISMALFMFGYIRDSYIKSATISSSIYYTSCAILIIYAVTIVFGRLYTGMHSFIDCAFGVILGASIWGAYVVLKNTIENWLQSGRWIGDAYIFHPCLVSDFFLVPLTVTPVCLLLVHYHPQPVDDCPCFEDAIAFVSVILGVILCRWHIVYSGINERLLGSVMPAPQGTTWGWEDTASWWALACAKVTVGSSLFPFPFHFHDVPHRDPRNFHMATSRQIAPAPHASANFPSSRVLLRSASSAFLHARDRLPTHAS